MSSCSRRCCVGLAPGVTLGGGPAGMMPPRRCCCCCCGPAGGWRLADGMPWATACMGRVAA
eukprot:354565-Chlamydomonas_euryale.AAC.1